MDISDVGIKHAVRFNDLTIRHTIDFTPSVASIAKEIRYCVIALVLGFSTVTIVKSFLSFRDRSRSS